MYLGHRPSCRQRDAMGCAPPRFSHGPGGGPRRVTRIPPPPPPSPSSAPQSTSFFFFFFLLPRNGFAPLARSFIFLLERPCILSSSRSPYPSIHTQSIRKMITEKYDRQEETLTALIEQRQAAIDDHHAGRALLGDEVSVCDLLGAVRVFGVVVDASGTCGKSIVPPLSFTHRFPPPPPYPIIPAGFGISRETRRGPSSEARRIQAEGSRGESDPPPPPPPIPLSRERPSNDDDAIPDQTIIRFIVIISSPFPPLLFRPVFGHSLSPPPAPSPTPIENKIPRRFLNDDEKIDCTFCTPDPE